MRPSVVRALVVLAAAAACRAGETPAVPPPMPQVSGTIAVDGLAAPVTVVRDRWGVPHIEAESRDDLFFAQGYVQAQDRLFQMDLWRRSSLGRLAEVFGPTFIGRDAMTQRMRYRGDLDEEWAHYGPDARPIVTAFVRGVNARVAEAQRDLPEAFRLAGWSPEPWTPEDLLNRTDAFVASGNIQEEVLRAQLMAELGPATADALFPPRSGRTIVPGDLDLAVISPLAAEAVRRAGTPPFFVGFGGPGLSGAGSSGSNAWAVGGALSASGAPLLAADPHRLLAHPSLRYLVHLRAPGWNVAGAAAPWLPGVVIGHNERIAWSFTARAADTQDLFLERTNPDDPGQVRDGSRWVDMATQRVAIASKGREPLEYDEQFTPRGVVVALDAARHLAYVVRWSGHDAGGAAELGALALNQADSWESFLAAATRWRMPPVEFVYADVEGRIARVNSAAGPVRRGWTGEVPAPAWTGRQGWQPVANGDGGTLDPIDGYVVSANGDAWRVRQIQAALAAGSPHTVEAFTRLQQDVTSPQAEALVPLLGALSADDLREDVESARRQLLAWDRRMTPASPEAGLFDAWRERLFTLLVSRRVPQHLQRDFLRHARHTLPVALVTPTDAWFDGEPRAARDRLLLEALDDTVGPDGRAAGAAALGEVLFAYPLALTPETRERFNAGPLRIGGSRDAIQSMAGDAPGEMIGPSFRLVVDLADWDSARVTQAPGQSELPDSPHFRDLADAWGRGEFVPLLFSEEAIAAAAQHTLQLTPR